MVSESEIVFVNMDLSEIASSGVVCVVSGESYEANTSIGMCDDLVVESVVFEKRMGGFVVEVGSDIVELGLVDPGLESV